LPENFFDSARRKLLYFISLDRMNSGFSFNKYRISFIFGCWLLPEKFNFCPKKIMALPKSGGCSPLARSPMIILSISVICACNYSWPGGVIVQSHAYELISVKSQFLGGMLTFLAHPVVLSTLPAGLRLKSVSLVQRSAAICRCSLFIA